MPSNKGVAKMNSFLFKDQQVTENSYSKIWTLSKCLLLLTICIMLGK